MESFNMKIVGLTAHIQPVHITTKEYFRAFISEDAAELYIHVTHDDMIFEQMMFEREALEEGMKIRKFSDPFLERACIQRRFADELLNRNTLLLHGSTVCVDGEAYLFTAPCGTGKSTHTRLWRQIFGERAVMVNDDKTFLQITSDSVLAYGSPWSGKHGLHTNICVPLKGICILSRGKENQIRQLPSEDGLAFLVRQSHIPLNTSGEMQVSALMDQLLKKVPLWQMQCNMDSQAAAVSYAAMSSV